MPNLGALRLAGRRVEARLGASIVVVRADGQVVAQHPRSLHKGTEDLVLDHYLEILVRKPGALAGATALAAARAAGAFTDGHQRFWDSARRALGDGPGTRALIGALLLHRTMPAHAVLAGMAAAHLGPPRSRPRRGRGPPPPHRPDHHFGGSACGRPSLCLPIM